MEDNSLVELGDKEEDEHDDASLNLEKSPLQLEITFDPVSQPTPSTSTLTKSHVEFATKTQRKRKHPRANQSQTNQLQHPTLSKFPTPFECCGDFCEFVLEETIQDNVTTNNTTPRSLLSRKRSSYRSRFDPSQSIEASTAMQLFSNEERALLGDEQLETLLRSMKITRINRGEAKQVESRTLHEITYKSIALGKPNKKHLLQALEDRQSTNAVSNLTETKKRFMETTLSHEIREEYRHRTFGEMDNVVNFYRQVRVCQHCYVIYQLLDRARTLGKHPRQDKASTVKAMWGTMVDQEVERKEKLYLRVPGKTHTSSTLVTSVSTPNLPVSDIGITLPVISSPHNSGRRDETPVSTTLVSSKISSVLPRVQSPLSTLKSQEAVVSMDKYLRGVSKEIEPNNLHVNELFARPTRTNKTTSHGTKPRLSVLLIDSDREALQYLHQHLTQTPLPCLLQVESHTESTGALHAAQSIGFDFILIERNMSGMNGMEFTTLLRQYEVQRSLNKTHKRTPILCMTDQTSSEELKLYKQVGMDGCIGKPFQLTSLMQTIQAVIHQLMSSKALSDHRRQRHRQQLAASLPGIKDLPSYQGIFQMDAETSFPYCIVGKSHSQSTLFNLVIIHDMFDTWEKLQILLQPIINQYAHAVQILVWNYPGQAYTTWRQGTVLNNTYHVECFHALVHYLGSQGQAQWNEKQPFHLIGIGNGGNIASLLVSKQHLIPEIAMIRSLVIINSFLYIDEALTQFFHDTLKVLSCTPASRGDLPIYFHARFLFSPTYLARVTTPLALNLYTAVMNPITLAGRIALCQGALQHEDVRLQIKTIHVPILQICSSHNTLVNNGQQTQEWIQTGLELVDSIATLFRSSCKSSVVIWMSSGHEVIQECKSEIILLFEQLMTGYHEPHGKSKTCPIKVESVPTCSPIKSHGSKQESFSPIKSHGSKIKSTYEDSFIDRVLTTVNHVIPSSPPIKIKSKPLNNTVWNPLSPSFERLSLNKVYKTGTKLYPDTKQVPHVQEYMEWRIQRNQKRLARMERLVCVIQKAFRAYLARTMVQRMRRNQAAIHLQRIWRAKMARNKYKGMQRRDWAIRLVQRAWRGKLGRQTYKQRFQQYLAAINIQRIVRGYLTRIHLFQRQQAKLHAIKIIQSQIRCYLAKQRVWKQRYRHHCAIKIQKIYRGHIGRHRYRQEQEKYLFAKTQSQGIVFGKQLLMEYKLYGTKLQSQVTLLISTKTQMEKETERILNEITSFEQGIQVLEKEMHELSQLEIETSMRMDEQSKWNLREQKMRLDREFTQLLTHIAQRKEQLIVLEEQLQKLDKERIVKEEELKGLERKLVILLDEQQRELHQIQEKQHSRRQMVLNQSSLPMDSNNLVQTAAIHSSSEFSSQQREEANALMESTETMMKFGFMSMSMTYFSSMNMVRAMRKIGAHHLTLDSAAMLSNQKWPQTSPASSPMGFQPSVPPGHFTGQQPIQVSGWSVADVLRWLDTLALGQYKRAFQDASVDGALLYHLNEDDLKNTLGMEHRLHRKKILTCVEQLREQERIKMKRLYPEPAIEMNAMEQKEPISIPLSSSPSLKSTVPSDSIPSNNSKILISFSDFCSLVRHGKLKQIKEALISLPERLFDTSLIHQAYKAGMGTIYEEQLEKSIFHINKGDENGNSPLMLAAQNNQLKVIQYLLSKGANPNHQNKHGNTAGHYAMAYSFFDLGAWLLDPEKGGGRDDIVNEAGLTAYDGLG